MKPSQSSIRQTLSDVNSDNSWRARAIVAEGKVVETTRSAPLMPSHGVPPNKKRMRLSSHDMDADPFSVSTDSTSSSEVSVQSGTLVAPRPQQRNPLTSTTMVYVGEFGFLTLPLCKLPCH